MSSINGVIADAMGYPAHKAERISGPETPRPTRFPELGFRQDGPGLWRIVAMDGEAATGPIYQSKAELLLDLERFAGVYGATGASPVVHCPGCRCQLITEGP